MDVEQRARAVFGLSWADYWMGRGQPDVAHDFDAFSRAEAWALQRFPAALTPPEGYVVVTRNEVGQAVAVTRQDDEGRILSAIAEFGAPEGYVLVPVELPVEMEIAFMEAWVSKRRCIDDPEMQDAWEAALAARPEVTP
ncbi:Uncharacterised protein [Stenotrophomonas maltophilia]|uniref:hypothetical protein n=1 Tax=Stenotrophomonas maltophilia TaxID=40324 RepID=UPI000DA33E0D|nr:hypothetical protein [Stenotrophomonas maltophilia]SQG66894.1 Uncharacterised protein [Stenotrophomonas maltophilia]